MAGNDLRIKIIGTLNVGSTIGEINTALKGIEKKINKLKIDIQLDDKITKTLSDFSESMEKYKNASKDLNKVIKEEKEIIKDVHGVTTELTKQYTKSGQEIVKNKRTIDQRTKSLEKEKEVTGDLLKSVDQLGKKRKEVAKYDGQGNFRGGSQTYRDGNKDTTYNYNQKGSITNYKEVENIAQQEKEIQKLNKSKDDLLNKTVLLNKENKLNNEMTEVFNRLIKESKSVEKVQEYQRALQLVSKGRQIENQQIKEQIAIQEKRIQEEKSYEQFWLKSLKQREIEQKKLNDQLEHQLSLFKQQATINDKNLRKKFDEKDIDTAGLDRYLMAVNSLSTSTPDLKKKMDNLDMSFKNIKASVNAATSHTLTFGDQMKIAFERSVIWGVAMTSIYGTVNALQQMVDTLYLLDDRLVSIKKVMDDVNLAQVFDNATESAYKYGQTIDSALSSIEEIGKLGFGQADAQVLSENSMLLSTVGEFKSTADAANYLVAIMRQYKLEVSDTAKVVDSLNEISNKTGADTVSLAQGLSKASSSASIAGVTFDELNAMIASTVETLKIGGNEAGTFYKALFTRMQRASTQKDIEAIGVATKDMAGEMLPATEILRNIGAEFDKLDSNTQSSIAESLGGVWHSNKVISLLQNQEQVLKNTTTSIESYGSASKELENFSEGLTFKTNQMKASFQELSMTIGENGARGAIVAFLETVTFMVQGFNDLTDATNGWNIKLPLLIGGVYGLVKAITLLSTVAKGAKLSLGWIGAGIVGLELLGGAMAGVAKSNEESISAFTESAKTQQDNADKLEALLSKYNELKPQIDGNKDAQLEYKKVLDEIVRIAPQTVQVTDDYGNAIDIAKGKVEGYIDTLRTMSDEQLKNAEILVNNSIITAQNDLDKLMQKQAESGKEIQKMFDFIQEYNDKYDVDTLSEAKLNYGKRTEELGLFGKEAQAASQEFARYNDILTMHSSDLQEYSDLQVQVSEKEAIVDDLKSRQQQLKLLNTEYSELSETVKKTFDNKIDSSIYGEFDKSQLVALIQFGEEYNKNSEALQEHLPILKEAKISNEQIDVIIKSVTSSQNDLTNATYDGSEGMDALAESTSDVSDAQEELLSTSERLVGVSKKQIDSTKEQIANYRILTSLGNLTAEQSKMLAEAEEYLSNVYPHLVEGTELRIEAMEMEAEQSEILLKALDMMQDGQLTIEQEMTLTAALNARSRISLLLEQAKAYEAFANRMAKEADALAAAGDQRGAEDAEIRARKYQGRANDSYSNFASELESILPDMDKWISQLADATNYTGKNYKAVDRQSKSYENATYVSDTFKQSLEKVNLELEKQSAIQAKFPKHSEEYQKSLKHELELLKEKEKILKSQAKSLDAQIKAGKIQETGVVKTSSYSATSGGSNADQIWSFFKSKGFSDSIVAGIMGNLQMESGLNPNATNKSSGAYGLAQWLGSRKTELQKYAKSIGQSVSDIDTQLNFLWKELNSTEKRTLNWLTGNQNATASAVAAMFDKLFERSEGTHVPQRQDYANRYYNQYAGTLGSASGNVASYYLDNFKVTSNYGDTAGRSSAHKGIDFANGRQGDLVKAVKGGKVITATYSKSAGNWVVIQQDDGTVAKYMHMQNGSLAVKAGQRVETGQTLGKVGNTGQSTGAHLHFQVEQNGKAIDPMAYLRGLGNTASATIAEDLQSVDQAKSELMSLYGDIEAIQQEIEQVRHAIIMSYVDQYDYQVAMQEKIADRLELSTYHLSTSSQSYRDELGKQRDALIERQRLIGEEEKAIRNLMKTTQMSENTRLELRARLDDLYDERFANAARRDEISMRIIASLTEEYTEAVDDLNFALEKNAKLQEMYADGSKEQNELIKEEIALTKQKQKEILKHIQMLEQQLLLQDLTIEQQKEINEAIEDAKLEYYDLGSSESNQVERYADNIINALKQAYEEKRDLEVAAKEHEIEQLEEAHEERMKKYDDDLEAYEKLINKKLRLIDDLYSEDQFNKEMEKLQKEELELREKINILMLDDSQEAIAKRKQYEEDLARVQEDIEQSKHDRNIELRKQNLNDEADQYRESVEQQKEAEQEKFDASKQRLEDEITEIEYFYNEILNNERYFAEMRQQIMDGNIEEVQQKLGEFIIFFKSQNEELVKELGKSWQGLLNIIDDVGSAQKGLLDVDDIVSGRNGSFDPSNPEMVADWEKYLQNKRDYDGSTPEEKKRLAAENTALREKWGFMDGHYNYLENFDVISGEHNQQTAERLYAWKRYLDNKKMYETATTTARKQELAADNARIRKKYGFPDGHWKELEKLKIYHDGGIISGRGNRLTELANKLFNAKPNEQVVKALKGELFVPEKNIPNFLSNISNLVGNLTPNVAVMGAPVVNISIDNYHGTNKEINTLESRLVNTLKNFGKL